MAASQNAFSLNPDDRLVMR